MRLIKNNTHFYYLIFILAFVLLGYREVAFFRYTLVYDMIDVYFPWRYFIGESLQNFQLPLWEPYQHLGTPIYANPQSGAWYPFVWLISLVHGYDIYALHIETVVHLVLAGWGFYFLLDYLNIARKVAVIGGCVYVFTGFFVGNAQHLSWLISAAWIPFIVRYYLLSLDSGKLKHFIITALFIFMLLSGGYPAFTIVLVYVLLGILIYYCYSNRQEIKKYLITSGVIALFATLFSMVIIVSVIHVAPWYSRGSGLDFISASALPFSLHSWISFLFPYATTQDLPFFETDISMSNGYFGVISLALILHSILFCRSRFTVILYSFALLCFLIALGSATPLYKFVYSYVPGFSYFRSISLLRFFGISMVLIGVFYSISNFIEEKIALRIVIPIITVALLIIGVLLFVYLNMQNSSASHSRLMMYHCIIKQGFFHVCLLLGLLVPFLVLKESKTRYFIIGALLLIDISVAARLNFQYTEYSGVPVQHIKWISQSFPKGFPVNMDTIAQFDEGQMQKDNLCRNLAIFQKKHSIQGFNSFILTSYLRQLGDTAALKRITNHPLIFSEDTSSKTTIIQYNPQRIVAKISANSNTNAVLLQSYLPDWKAIVNGKQVPIHCYKNAFISVPITKGMNEIELSYAPSIVIYAFYGSISALFIAILALFILSARRNEE